MELPFGRTKTDVREVRDSIDVDAACGILEDAQVDYPHTQVDLFVQQIPALLAWLGENGRVYPWRTTTDPWRVYVSEILLQRTHADDVEEVYPTFFDKFPDPSSIITTSDEEIKSTIVQLGFGDKRTKTLNDVAKIVNEDHEGNVPESIKELQRPWRVGPYTARACLEFSFGQSLGLVDANISRVISRVFSYEMPDRPHESGNVYNLLDALVPTDPELCRAINLALLDLADSICTSSSPVCSKYPLSEVCSYNKSEELVRRWRFGHLIFLR